MSPDSAEMAVLQGGMGRGREIERKTGFNELPPTTSDPWPRAKQVIDRSYGSIAMDLGPTPLLAWLPGETLFSLCSRQHRFWGHRHSWSTASLLFGSRQSGTQHDLPNQLDQFAARTGQLLGTADALAEQRTLLRYYRPFLSQADLDNAVLAMRSRSVAHLKLKLGLLTSRFRANHSLKACVGCMDADRAECGCPYWHLEHQYPGVWICLHHGDLLRESRVKSTGVGRFLWSLPSIEELDMDMPTPGGGFLSRLRSLAELIVAVVDAAEVPGWLRAERMQSVLLTEVQARGWLSSAGSLRLKSMSADFLAYSAELRTIREFDDLPHTTEDAERQLGRLLRPLRSGTHPLRLLTVAHWLFGNITALRQALKGSNDGGPQAGAGARVLEPLRRNRDDERREAVERIQTGESPSAVAKSMGVDVSTVKTWAASAGIATERRASVIRPPILDALKADLGSGIDKAVAASKHGISISSVTRILRTEVGLSVQWRTAREIGARKKARDTWEELLAVHGHQGTKVLRAADPAAYAWLYRNDLAWLRVHQPTRQVGGAGPGLPRLLWDERDRALKAAVEAAVLELRTSNPRGPLYLWQVYQKVPELKAKLSRLDRMPLTSMALERALVRTKRRAGSE